MNCEVWILPVYTLPLYPWVGNTALLHQFSQYISTVSRSSLICWMTVKWTPSFLTMTPNDQQAKEESRRAIQVNDDQLQAGILTTQPVGNKRPWEFSKTRESCLALVWCWRRVGWPSQIVVKVGQVVCFGGAWRDSLRNYILDYEDQTFRRDSKSSQILIQEVTQYCALYTMSVDNMSFSKYIF